MFNIETEFGIAEISDKGYYRITSVKEGNCGKYLHRLIYEKYKGDSKRGNKSPFWKDYARVTKGGVKNGKKVYSLKYNGKVVTTTPYKEQLQEIADKINNAEDRDVEFKEQFKIIRRKVYYITKMGFKRGKQVFALKYSGNLIQRSVDKNKLVKLADSLNLINKWSMIY